MPLAAEAARRACAATSWDPVLTDHEEGECPSTSTPRRAPLPSARVGAPLNVILRRSLGRFDLLMMAVAAVISVDTIGTVAAGGGTAFTAMLILVIASSSRTGWCSPS